MACKYCIMQTYKIQTTVDITESKARKGEDSVKYGQQQNYMTLINVLGLRTNITPVKTPSSSVLDNSAFGTKGQKVWEFIFSVESEDSTSIEAMVEDFNLIPFVNNLTESVTFKTPVFQTQKNPNITFEIYKI